MAGGRWCTLLLNRKVQLGEPSHRTFAYLDSDCAAAGTDSARWDIRHRARGQVAAFSFAGGNIRADWVFTGTTPLGTYDIVPTGASDLDAPGGPTAVPQNTMTASVRLRSWLALGARRSGRYVTLHGLATRWSRLVDAPRPWRHHQVRLWYRTCRSCPLQEMKSRRTNAAGRFSFRVYAPKVRRWTARTEDRAYTWGARPVDNPGERTA